MYHLNKKHILLFCLVTAFIIGYLSITNLDSHDKESPPIKLVVSLWAGDAHAFIAKELGIFEKNGVNVELIYREDYPDAQQLYQYENVDGLFSTMSDAIYYNSGLVSSKIVYITDYSDGADVIVGNMGSFDEIKGKTISVENINSYSHIFVLSALNKIGLTENDVYFKTIPAQDVVAALDAGIIDAGHTWEPSTTKAKNYGYKVLFTSGEIPFGITSTLILKSDLLEQRPEDVRKIVQSLIEAQEYRDNNWEKSLEIMAKHLNLTTSKVQSGFVGIHTLNLTENLEVFNSDLIKKQIDFISKYYIERGQIDYSPQLEDVIDSRFVKEISVQRNENR